MEIFRQPGYRGEDGQFSVRAGLRHVQHRCSLFPESFKRSPCTYLVHFLTQVNPDINQIDTACELLKTAYSYIVTICRTMIYTYSESQSVPELSETFLTGVLPCFFVSLLGGILSLRSLSIPQGPEGADHLQGVAEADVRVSVHGKQLSLQGRAHELPESVQSQVPRGDLHGDAPAHLRDGAVLPGLHDAGGAGQPERARHGHGVLLLGLLFRSDGDLG